MTGARPDDVSQKDALTRMIKTAAGGFSATLPTPKTLTALQLPNLPLPVYIALAEHSLITKGARKRVDLIPHAQVKIWPNTTHSLPMAVAPALDKELELFGQTSENPANDGNCN